MSDNHVYFVYLNITLYSVSQKKRNIDLLMAMYKSYNYE